MAAPIPEPSDGAWRVRSPSWHEPVDLHCSVCGRPLIARAWIVTVGGRARTLCGPECEQLLRSGAVADEAVGR